MNDFMTIASTLLKKRATLWLHGSSELDKNVPKIKSIWDLWTWSLWHFAISPKLNNIDTYLILKAKVISIISVFFLLHFAFQMKQIAHAALAIFLIIECSCVHNALSRKLISSTIRGSSTESPLAPPFNSQFNLNSTTNEQTWVYSNERALFDSIKNVPI